MEQLMKQLIKQLMEHSKQNSMEQRAVDGAAVFDHSISCLRHYIDPRVWFKAEVCGGLNPLMYRLRLKLRKSHKVKGVELNQENDEGGGGRRNICKKGLS